MLSRLMFLGMIWMGLFMAPGLPLLNLIKLVAIFYIKSWAVLVTNVPHEIVFKVLTILLSIFCKMNIRNLFARPTVIPKSIARCHDQPPSDQKKIKFHLYTRCHDQPPSDQNRSKKNQISPVH